MARGRRVRASLVRRLLWAAVPGAASLLLIGTLPAPWAAGQAPKDCDPTRPQVTYVHAAGGVVLSCKSYPGQLPQMEERVVTPAIGRKSGEPMVAITPNGDAFFNSIDWDAPADYGGRTDIFRTRDQGLTWQLVTPNVAGQDMPPSENDPFLKADPVTGRVFSLDLWLLPVENGCNWLVWSDDGGDNWSQNPVACGKPVNDHENMWVGPATMTGTVGYPNVVYLCTDDLVLSFTCTRSLDGGQTFLPATGPTYMVTDSRLATCPGPDPVLTGGLVATGQGKASWVDGTAYVPWGYCGVSYVTISRDNGATWETSVVDATSGRSAVWQEAMDSTIAIDRAGNVYYMWIGANGLPQLSISRDRGNSWSSPVSIAAPGVTDARFPAITAGAPGQIAFSYYGTNVPGGVNATAGDMANAAWNDWTGFSLDALAGRPVFASTTANPITDPVRRGPCIGRCPDQTDECKDPANQGTDECDKPWEPGSGVYDFLDAEVNPTTGQVWTSIVDVCNDACGRPDGTGADPAIPRGAVAVQVGGTFLGSPLPART